MDQLSFKLFISYNRQNQPFVRAIVQGLTQAGFDASLEVFFDEDNLLAGDQWIQEIERALVQSRACLVFIGPQGIGGWQNKEVLKAVNQGVGSNGIYRIIPVLLPDEKRSLTKSLPWFLSDYQWVEFTEPVDALAFAQLVDGLRKNSTTGVVLGPGVTPYKGLDYFEVKNDLFFFGRTYDINWVFYKKLRLSARSFTDRFLAVVGDSGSGKSSFVRAGLLASLKAGKYAGSQHWKQVITKPDDRPLLKLSTALVKAGIITDSAAFDHKALEDKDCLRRIAEVYGQKFVLFIDQFEEVITQCKDEAERQAYLDNVASATHSDYVLLIVTLRSDFYASFSRFKAFADILESNNYTLSGLDFTAGNPDWERYIQEMIEKPTRIAGVTVEMELRERIIEDLNGVNGLLTVLQMALNVLWRNKKSNASVITLTDYEELSGNRGISGIIEKNAEQAYEAFTRDDNGGKKESLLKALFIRLVSEWKEDIKKIGKALPGCKIEFIDPLKYIRGINLTFSTKQ